MQPYLFPCPESANKLEHPFWALSLSTLLHKASSPQQTTSIAPQERYLLSMEKAVCWEGVLEGSITLRLSLDIVTAISFSSYLLR